MTDAPQPPAQRLPAQRLGIILRLLIGALLIRAHFGLSQAMIGLISLRIQKINFRIRCIAELVHAGKYVPRRPAAAPTRAPRRQASPRPQNPLKFNFGWILKLVPDSVVSRASIEQWLDEDDVKTLIAAAPALRRPLRSLCWMLLVKPPAILALPKRAAKPAKPKPPKPPKPPPAPPLPAYLRPINALRPMRRPRPYLI